MPANTTPLFLINSNSVPITLASANLASDGSGGLSGLTTGSTNGTRIDAVSFRNSQTTQAASSAMLGKIFLSNASGTSPKLIGEILIPAVTRSATVIGSTATFTFSPALVIQSGQVLSVAKSIHAGAQDNVDVIAFAGDF